MSDDGLDPKHWGPPPTRWQIFTARLWQWWLKQERPMSGIGTPTVQDIERPERSIAALEQRIKELENPPCCRGGPQWGHDWNCPTLP